METENRYASLDVLKAICIFMVICIHIQIPGKTSTYFLTLTRIAVPVFFMITGFFYLPVCSAGKEGRQIIKIAKMFFWTNLLYFLWQILSRIPSGTAAAFLNEKVLTPQAAINFFVFNESPFAVHLWYLSALLYVLLIFYFFNRVLNIKYLLILTPFLLITALVTGKYSVVLFGTKFNNLYPRNFLTVGIPYFSLGILIRKYSSRITLSSRSLMLLCIPFALIPVAVRYVLNITNMNGNNDHYLCTTLLAVCLFLLAVKNPDTGKGSFAAKIGRDYSGDIYLYHVFIIFIIWKVIQKPAEAPGYIYYSPFLAAALSLLAVMLLARIKRLVQACLKSESGIV